MADLDRRIRLTVQAPGGTDGQGRFVEGAIITDVILWAHLEDLGSAEDATSVGRVVTSFTNYTVRWREDLARTRDGLLALYDDQGRKRYILKTREIGRRRFLEIETGYSSR